MREYLVDLRKKLGKSQQDVAEEIGVSRQYYSFIESGERQRQLDITLAAKLSSALSVPISYIIDQETNADTSPGISANQTEG